MEEIWKDIQGYEGLYQVSNLGRVRSLNRTVQQKHYSGKLVNHLYEGKVLKPNSSRKYVLIDLHKNQKIKRYSVHRLVAEAFIPKVKGKSVVNHKDSNPLNNKVSNLEWCTQSENIQYAYDLKRKEGPNKKMIEQYDQNGNFIKLWESITDIEKELKIHHPNISKVCLGKRKTAGGYIWKYMN